MAKASKPTANASDAFVQAVERALERFGNPDWLGNQSPLAAPYFLGNLLDHADALANPTPIARGTVLQQALLSAAKTLPNEQQALLNATFFQRKPNLNNTGVALEMNLSESTYYRRRVEAIAAIANALNQSVIPPLRNELPTPLPSGLIGRASFLQQGLTALRGGQSLAITGRSGVGKTALGATLAHQWDESRAFWFTVRPGLNDNLNSFAFALAHFLRAQGASNTWRQLVADRGASNATQVLGLLRHDLATLATAATPALLCIDESDQLRLETRAHSQVIHAIEALSASTPVLLLSQQLLIEAQHHLNLIGLTLEESAQLFAQEQCPALAAAELQQLHTVTRGMPALLKLSALLMRSGETVSSIAQQLQEGRSVEVLFNRIWKRLSESERGFLMALSLFRSAAPHDAWPDQSAAIESLIARDLIQIDRQGGIAVLSHVREFIAQRIPADTQPVLHQMAAGIREARGEYTEAAYHLMQADQPASALWLWFTHREQERERGQAHAVAELFSRIKQSDLPDDEDRKALALLRAEYAIAQGEGPEAEQALEAERWPWSHPALPYVRQLQGDALELQGRVEQALARYREGMQTGLPQGEGQRVRLQVKSGYIYVARLRDLAQAHAEADVALWRAEQFKGNVEEERGRFAIAQQHYEAALRIAQTLAQNTGAVAEVHHHLGHLYMRMGEAEAAIRHLNIALAHAEQTGEPVNALYDRLNLASAYIVAGQFAAAVEQGQMGLALAREIQHPFLVAGLAACTAEAHLGQGALDEAEPLALQSLAQEEEVHRPYALTVLGQIQHQRGHRRQAERTLRLAIESAQATQDPFAEAPAQRALAALMAESK